jgi:hypothetical protein
VELVRFFKIEFGQGKRWWFVGFYEYDDAHRWVIDIVEFCTAHFSALLQMKNTIDTIL